MIERACRKLVVFSFFLLIAGFDREAMAQQTLIDTLAGTVCSSENPSKEQTCDKAVDGWVNGYPADATKEWVTSRQKVGAWIQLNWSAAVTVSRVVLHDRPNSNDQVLGGKLSFSDGSSIAVGKLPNDGSGLEIRFSKRSVKWMKFTVTGVSDTTSAIGLSELYASSESGSSATLFNEALFAFVEASGGRGAELAQDAVVRTGKNGWYAPVGSSLKFDFDGTKRVSRLVLRDSVELDSQITKATITFSDGSVLKVGKLPDDGAGLTLNFAPKNVTWMKVKLTSTRGIATGLSEVEAYSFLEDQRIRGQQQFNGADPGWSIVDNGQIAAPSEWTVSDGTFAQSSEIRDQTSNGYQLGTYAIWPTLSHTDLDLRLRVRANQTTDLEPGFIGVMFAYRDDNNYYRLNLSRSKGTRSLEKKKNGVFSELARGTQGFDSDEWSNLRVVFRNGVIVAFVNGKQVLAAQDDTFSGGKVGVWNSATPQESWFDKVFVLTAPRGRPVVGLTKPSEDFVKRTGLLDFQAVTTDKVGGIEFVADEGQPEEKQKKILGSGPYQTELNFSIAGTHTIHVYGLDSNGTRVKGSDAVAKSDNLGVRGLHLVGFGASISNGMFDTIADDDTSQDSRNTSGGYEPVLNDKLTEELGVPVTVIDEGNPGDTSAVGAAKIKEVLRRNPEANIYLVILGTNDSSGSNPVDASTYKSHMKEIADTILEAGPDTKVFFAKLPPRLNRTKQTNVLKTYNAKLVELVNSYASKQPGRVLLGPDLMTWFTNHPEGMYTDGVHPNGQGYQAIGQLWLDTLRDHMQ